MSNPIEILVHELSRLPGIGNRTALRLAVHILRQPPEFGQRIARALEQTVANVHFCKVCCNIATEDLCHICRRPDRDSRLLCVVEDIADLQAIEQTLCFRGHYHVLHGALSPLDGVGPDDLKLAELKARLACETPIQEVVLATNPNVTGDATALYLTGIIRPLNKKITRLASGIPVGGHIEFIDSGTLSRAFAARCEVE